MQKGKHCHAQFIYAFWRRREFLPDKNTPESRDHGRSLAQSKGILP
jgi:hypothetical protein